MNKRYTDDRVKVSRKFGDSFVEDVFTEKNNFRGTVKVKDGQYKLNDERSLSLSLKDGIDGFFALNGFDLWDLTPNLPLTAFFYPEFVPTRFGGGFVERVSAFRLNYQLAQGRLTGTKTNERELTDVKEAKVTVPAYAFQYATNITEFELMKTKHISFDLYGYKLEALRLSYQKELEWFAFKGNEGVSDIAVGDAEFVGGLLNNDLATVFDLDFDWLDDTVDLNDFVKTFTGYVKEMNQKVMWNSDFYVDTLAVPPTLMTKLLQASVVGELGAGMGTGIAVSLYDYLKKQLSNMIGKEFTIKQLPYIDSEVGADNTTAGITAHGKNATGMAVLYRNNERTLRMNIPMALTGGAVYMTESGLKQNYIALITPPLVIYPAIAYINNKAE